MRRNRPHPRRMRVSGTGTGARLSAFVLGPIWIGANVIGTRVWESDSVNDLSFWFYLSVALGLAFMVRSLFCGVVIDANQLKIVSWYYTRRYPRNAIAAITYQSYAGLFTNGGGGANLLSTRTKMIGVRLTSGREKLWPVTIMTNHRCDEVTQWLGKHLDKPIERVQDF
ncbi:hypothetical protein [Labedella gwakjiensis]|uniref:PH (Pleckstrin Homology) domain-containing protein n=2 Tax=Labedella gwakjiensis TaxID=390269 RepID=A0ABY0C9I9_9MICO|nr:hypothetical protein [Labedella gwakjiensis]RUQ86657.1 hypothetical protein ELQ93_06695 [Labedella gwakjiensis]